MSSFVSSFLSPHPTRRRFGLVALLCAAAWVLCVVGGCGGGDDQGALLAQVGDVEIRVADYEENLGLIEKNELPRDEHRQFLDMSQLEGKQEFLTTLVNKELMVNQARVLGYADDANVVAARQSLLAYEANVQMASEVMETGIKKTSDEDFARYYALIGEARTCSYLVTNFKEDAEAAREAVLGGEDWQDIRDRFHEGSSPAKGRQEITVPYGRYDEKFEAAIFATGVGEYSQPVETAYGWWLLRVENIDQADLPPLEEMKGRIDNVNFNRQKARMQMEFRDATRKKHNAWINEEALWKVYQGLPEEEQLLDPETQEPIPDDQLAPLDVTPMDLDLDFYAYDAAGERHTYTVADYKDRYDRMSTFARPKKEHMVTGLRHKIEAGFERSILNDEAKLQGYFEHPAVLAKVNHKVEEIMITNLYGDLVVFDKRITPEDLEGYWAEHADDFATPEKRTGRLVIAEDEASAAAARAQLVDGALWKDIVQEYGTDENNQKSNGKLSEVAKTATGPVADALFAMAVEALSEPVDVGDGRYAVVRCDAITPMVPATIEDSNQRIGAAIRGQRKEDAFQQLLAKWTDEIGVVRHDENLDQVQSWEELTGDDE
ncbi:MAG: hypothetical protein GY838_19305 [bacterium]|nr:hypothetical protein [bacterium]